MVAQNALLVPGALTLIGGMAAVFYQTCAVGDTGCHIPNPIAEVNNWVYVFAPLLPIALVGYMAFLSRIMVLRSYYLRILETRIHDLTGPKDDPFPPIPSWGHLTLEVSGPARAEILSKLNVIIILSITGLMLFGCIWLAIWRIADVRLSVFALIVDGALTTIPIAIAVSNITGGAALWRRALEGLPARLERTRSGFGEKGSSMRKVVSYLVLPRKQEELLKSLFIPIAFFIGWLLVPGMRPKAQMTGYYLGYFLVFEFLIYQARYIWNDVRDRLEDSDPKTGKQRLPVLQPQDRDFALRAYYASFVSRLVLGFLVICLVLPFSEWRWAWHVSFVVAVFVFASIYEKVRSKCNAIGRAKGLSDAGLRRWTGALIIVVGFGYGLRAVVGFWLVGVENNWILFLLFLGASLFGSSFVSLTWALESTRELAEEWCKKKAHLALFRKILDGRFPNLDDSQKVLKGRQSWTDPWSWPAILATAALTWCVLYALVGPFKNGPLPVQFLGVHFGLSPLLSLILAEIFASILVVVLPVGFGLAITCLNFSVVSLILFSFFVRHGSLGQRIVPSLIAGAITSLPLIVVCFFRSRRFLDLPNCMSKLYGALGTALGRSYSWFARPRPGGQNETPSASSAPD